VGNSGAEAQRIILANLFARLDAVKRYDEAKFRFRDVASLLHAQCRAPRERRIALASCHSRSSVGDDLNRADGAGGWATTSQGCSLKPRGSMPISGWSLTAS
jgi:hypothetical protein